MIVVRSCILKSEFRALLAAKEGAAAVKYETDGWKKASQQTQDFCRTPLRACLHSSVRVLPGK